VTAPVHYELEVGYGCLYQPLCENQRGVDALANLDDDVEMTPDEAQVTCRHCLHALGYEILHLEAKELPNGRFQVAA